MDEDLKKIKEMIRAVDVSAVIYLIATFIYSAVYAFLFVEPGIKMLSALLIFLMFTPPVLLWFAAIMFFRSRINLAIKGVIKEHEIWNQNDK